MSQKSFHALPEMSKMGIGIILGVLVVTPCLLHWNALLPLLRQPTFWCLVVLALVLTERVTLAYRMRMQAMQPEERTNVNQIDSFPIPADMVCDVRLETGEEYRPAGPPNVFISLMRMAHGAKPVYLLACLALPETGTEQVTYVLDRRVRVSVSVYKGGYRYEWHLLQDEPTTHKGDVADELPEPRCTEAVPLGGYRMLVSDHLFTALDHFYLLRYTQGAWFREFQELEERRRKQN